MMRSASPERDSVSQARRRGSLDRFRLPLLILSDAGTWSLGKQWSLDAEPDSHGRAWQPASLRLTRNKILGWRVNCKGQIAVTTMRQPMLDALLYAS